MRTIMARTPHESSFSLSRRHFKWVLGKGSINGDDSDTNNVYDEELLDILPFSIPSSSSVSSEEESPASQHHPPPAQKKISAVTAVSRLRSALAAAIAGRHRHSPSLGPRVTGTLFGHRRGHVRFAFQSDPRTCPALLIELATPTCSLVKEMASGLVRIALECERKKDGSAATAGAAKKLVEEPVWRAYCNGRKCGYAVRRECSEDDWKVLRAVEPVSMGAGVIPGNGEKEGDVMYMRARFERVVGSKDSEAFYMMNPDSNGGPELSIYLLRV